jgi:hypothetical protein
MKLWGGGDGISANYHADSQAVNEYPIEIFAAELVYCEAGKK